MSETTANKIAESNDLCRAAMGVAGKLFQTAYQLGQTCATFPDMNQPMVRRSSP
jgi:hypothetical protein